MLTMTSAGDVARSALDAGASGYLVKETDPSAVLAAVHSVPGVQSVQVKTFRRQRRPESSGIDTGVLIKEFRGAERTAREEAAALRVAERWERDERSARRGHAAGHPIAAALG